MAMSTMMAMPFDRRWHSVVHGAPGIGNAGVAMLGTPAWAQRSEGDRRCDEAHHEKRDRP
jgi:hypothetical protein